MKQAFENFASNVFVLYGKDKVLAHSLMAGGHPGLSLANPLPALTGFKDPVLARMWDRESMRPLRIELVAPLEGHAIEVDGTDHVFVYRKIDSYTAVPLYAGAHFRSHAVATELERLRDSIVVGLAAVAISILVAVFIGRRLARPVTRLSAAARLIGQMNLDEIRDLPPSRVLELDQQSGAFNAMSGALKWFQAYVPRALVGQLLKSGNLAGLESDRRNITVMFTDIAGYSTVSEGKNAVRNRRPAQPPFFARDRGDRGGGRHRRQVHRRQRHGLLGRAGEAEKPRGPGLPCGAGDPGPHCRG